MKEADSATTGATKLTEQQQAVVDMFSDDEGSASHGGNGTEEAGGAENLADGVLLGDNSGGSQQSDGAAQFMDEESAENYRRILAKRRGTRPGIVSQTSADDLPDDPPGPAQQPRSSHARKRLRVSESESNEEELSVLDRRAVIPQRLRTRPAVSAARTRIEEARRSVNRPVCDSSSDSDTMPAAGDALCVGGAEAARKPARPHLDMPETDSEPEKTKPCAVLVIRDSSDDDDDFVSDPDDLPSRSRQPNKPAPHSAEVDRFLSTFEPMRALQMTQKSGSPGGPRHSQDLDSDLADFIVDDDDDVGDAGRGGGDSGHAGGFGVDLDGEDSSGGAGVGSDHPAGPAFTLDRPQGAMALMPEEFSQLDLPTSFKIYVQYLVYWIANDRSKPELSHDNARYFYLAYITVARVIDSIEQSLVASSAWVDDFRVDLNRFPEYSATGIASVPGCEACHFRQNRTATFCVTLSGTPYSRLELAPPRSVEYLASSEADCDTADVAGDDGAGSMTAMYKVGRTCKQRSELCHELHHYFYHLAHYVDIALLPALSKEGANDQSDLNPDDLVSTLEEEGVIDRLFHDFKSLLTRAKAGFTT